MLSRKIIFEKLREKFNLDNNTLVFYSAVFMAVFCNFHFFSQVLAAYPVDSLASALQAFSVFLVFLSVLYTFLTLVCFDRTIKPILMSLLLMSSLIAYFSDQYGVITDETMIQNVLSTDWAEAIDLFSVQLIYYFLFLGLLPSAIIYFVQFKPRSLKHILKIKAGALIASVVIILFATLPFGRFYASFLREHKALRYHTNPTYFIYSAGVLAKKRFTPADHTLVAVGKDAEIPEADIERELIIFVLGETARSDRFSLNGYERETNPRLAREKDLVSFTDVTACGTSTAVSVPCMFSEFSREQFNEYKGEHYENLMDVLTATGRVHILWRDNNSDSKGVALRVPYEDFKTRKKNTVCDIECRDEGMLVGLQDYIDSQKKDDVLIVLHQMGNHGPAYYKRYPATFEKFKPACHSNELAQCTNEEINNAYDNAILYTDYFLDKTIQLLKQNSKKFETAMVYVSDHGESLGENGLYLHGLPYAVAPKEQKKVATLFWFGGELLEDLDIEKVKALRHHPFSHENVFHTLLGLMEVETSVYKPSLNILSSSSVGDSRR